MAGVSENAANRLLLVEDSVSFAYAIKAKLEKEAGLEIVLARSLEEANEAIEKYDAQFFLALLDLTLPDASGDEIVLTAQARSIPSVVFSGSYSDELRERLFQVGAIDYLIKDNPHSLNYVVSLVRRVRANTQVKALVVDDSATARAQLTKLLRKYRFEVIEAPGGREALETLTAHPDIRLMITDFNMPGMNGHDLTKAARQKIAPDRLAIIGVSSVDAGPLSAKFLKLGANDFLKKPFIPEEFFCRITQNMEYLDQLDALREAALRDPLTGLHNRRHFFEMAETLWSQGHREGGRVYSIGMIDIDHFKALNDAHGHLLGDQVLKQVAQQVSENFRRGGDLVARFGGEEFCVFLSETDEAGARAMMEQVRAAIEAAAPPPGPAGAQTRSVTVSIGVAEAMDAPIAETIAAADRALYAAKDAGRNQVVAASASEALSAAPSAAAS
ncbi:MAG: diguanylate cyclase [Pseudomonadota bacterium]